MPTTIIVATIQKLQHEINVFATYSRPRALTDYLIPVVKSCVACKLRDRGCCGLRTALHSFASKGFYRHVVVFMLLGDLHCESELPSGLSPFSHPFLTVL